jgi:uncharacterized membrane protein YraQ (UPF0718 family)
VRAAPTTARPHADRRTLVLALGALALLALAVRIGDPGRAAWIRTALIVFGSLVVQALPFVVLGALASALIEVFVPPRTLERLAALPRPLQLPAAALAGVAFPICECGSVPVARRLIAKGLRPSAAITFMLAAPVVNPVVVASTYVAFRGRDTLWTIVGGRFVLGLVVAIAAGWAAGADAAAGGRDVAPTPPPPAISLGPPESRARRFFLHLGGDFLFMARFLLLGAAIAALVQTFLPTSLVSGVAGAPILAIVAMMGLAVVLSLCSESDAFIAASFSSFGPSAQLGFLVFGPMVDLKLIALYTGTFGRRFTLTLAVAAFATTLVGVLWIQVVAG